MEFMTGIHNTASGKLRVRFVEQSVGSLNLLPTSTATRIDSQKSIDRIDSALESLHEDRAVMAGHLATLNGDLQNVMATTAEYHDADGDSVGKGGVSERRMAGYGTGEDVGNKQNVGVMEMLRNDGYLDPETTGSG